MEKEKILVTGGAGFIGSHTCEALLARGKTVVCVDNFNDYYDPNRKELNIRGLLKDKNFKLYRADICDREKMRTVFTEQRVDKVIHLAARAGVRASFEQKELYERVNIDGTKNLLDLAHEFKVKNFVFGSSSSVYGTNTKVPFSEEDPIENTVSPYAVTKKQGEKICREYHERYGMRITCLRFFTVYGPRGRPDMAPYKFTKLIIEGKPIDMYGDGTTKRDYTYVTDIVDGILAALDKDLSFEIINLGDSSPITLKRFIEIIERATGKKANIKKMPMQRGDVPVTYAEISKAKRLLGYMPKVTIEDGMKRFVEWYRKDA